MAGQRRLSRSEREQRDARVIELLLAGLTYREIAGATGFRSVSGVHRVVQRELVGGAERRDVLTDDARALFIERSEGLLRAHWERATRAENPDHRSAELCRKVVFQQARMLGVGQDLGQPLPGPTQTLPDQDGDDDDGDDDLSRLRAKRNRTGG
ncbi:hypothetical protein [Mycobacterium simiae]|uniref:hypothetical protein n=1 Tax=Mycobacterium simiae TaxID=1784 RepID=UPI0026352AD7|nr:hypothetical protein [Mycobacterium simiae]